MQLFNQTLTMSDDPKGDLLRKSGPLGGASSIPDATVRGATPVQSAILYQNEEQISKIDKLSGKVDAFNTGAHGRMDRLERDVQSRLTLLEAFNAKLMILPRAIYWLVAVLGFDGLLKLGHMLGLLH